MLISKLIWFLDITELIKNRIIEIKKIKLVNLGFVPTYISKLFS